MASGDGVSTDELREIVARIRRPLDQAARDGFSRVQRVAGLEPFMRARAEELARVLGPRSDIASFEGLFAGFDRLTREERKDRILRAEALLRSIEQDGASASPGGMSTGKRTPAGQAGPFLAPGTSIQYCKNIGPRRAEQLKKIGIATVEDALLCLPWRYEDRGNLKRIGRLTFGAYETVCGQVISAEVVQTKRQHRKVFELVLKDPSGILIGSWFNQPFMQRTFTVGQTVILYGIVKPNPYRGGVPQMDSPDYEILDDEESGEASRIHTGRIVPVYRATAGLSVRAIRTMMRTVVDACAGGVEECLPPDVVARHALLPPGEAAAEVHFPTKEKDLDALNRGASDAHRRLSFEELFILELGLALRKRGVAAEQKGIAFKPPVRLEAALRKIVPFTLTAAQERVAAEIKRDMASARPMNRLVQGDVGCGKTVVALLAALVAVENGYQACIMAPTEILAGQHARNIETFARPIGISVRTLIGRQRKKDKEEVLGAIAAGAAQIVIGTHALLEEDVQFQRLGLAIIDEQHRFGVLQRSTLRSKGYEPDVLVMTATPIPRTLALTVYGDLDVSVIDELPPGRTPVETRISFEPKRRETERFIEEELRKGRQAYVVYPLVEETEKSDLKAATEMAAHLAKDVFPDRTVGLLHGRMKGDEKDAVMSSFKAGVTQVLVTTTVIEVGVDVPNATVMVIEHPERFGLAQLHQLRGRVGRGGHRSFCILMGPRMFTEETRDRLTAFARTTDGFRIAEEDLRLRGPGEFFGTRQSGLPDLRAANLIRDAALLEKARTEAFALVQADPALVQFPRLRALVARRWQAKLGLIDVS